MVEISEIVELHQSTVVRWHEQPIHNPYEDLLGLICQQHRYNFELWHQEDIARSPSASDSAIAQVKRNIDRLNQLRNDYIEKIDDWIAESLASQKIVAAQDARLNTETVGSVIDRLSIMAIRIFHYREQCQRADTSLEHRQKVAARLETCLRQKHDLAAALQQLVYLMEDGLAVHRIYRQFKMYNDPTLNPHIYDSNKAVDDQ
ncbi:MAG: DUF4254 domain-containing protein [Pirellulales bacterium]